MPHIHEKIDFTAEVFVVYKNTVLLRKHDKYKMWLSIGGHIELDEDPTETALREVKEEVGLDVTIVGPTMPYDGEEDYKELIPPRFLNRNRINDVHEHVTLTYFATTKSNTITQGNNEVSEEIKWFTNKELDDPRYGVKERIKRYAKSALKELGTLD